MPGGKIAGIRQLVESGHSTLADLFCRRVGLLKKCQLPDIARVRSVVRGQLINKVSLLLKEESEYLCL